MKKELTDRQRNILEFIREQILSFGRAPTNREIGAHFNISSTNGVRDHLKALIKKGYLQKDNLVSRGLRLMEDINTSSRGIPLVGTAPAGSMITAIENYQGEVAVDSRFMSGADSFALYVSGDSMINAGIEDGDMIIVRKQDHAVNGDIVVAVKDDEATIKRIFYEDGQEPGSKIARLQPENDNYQPIIIDLSCDNFYIAGKVVGLMRTFAH